MRMTTLRVCIGCDTALNKQEFLGQDLDHCDNDLCSRYGYWTLVFKFMTRCFYCQYLHEGIVEECPPKEDEK